MKFAFIAKHRSIWPVAWQCEALGVSTIPTGSMVSEMASEKSLMRVMICGIP